ncbi:MAG: CRTAC1 family protein [Planctomycetes bacterium]|nr:CRTAC1 family protein [Planctomycetota bacterium]
MNRAVIAILCIAVSAACAVALWQMFSERPRGVRRDPSSMPGLVPHGGAKQILEQLKQVIVSAQTDNPYIGDAWAKRIEQTLEALPADAPAKDRFAMLYRLAKHELQLGRIATSIEHFTAADEMIPAVRHSVPDDMIHYLHFDTGVAYMRMGELANCCASNNADSCIVPIAGGGVHGDQVGSRAAIGYFTRVLEATPVNQVHLQALWMLNLAHMTLGDWPEGVAQAWRLPTTTFTSPVDFPRFVNVAPEMGLDIQTLAGGAIADDFDGDGNIDLVVSDSNPSGQLRYFRNRGDASFEERTHEAGLTGLYGGDSIVQADYDNDGRLDILVPRGAWLVDVGRHPMSLLHNNGDGTFTDLAVEAGLTKNPLPSQAVAWADYDNDGWLDLYVGNETTPGFRAPSQLFHNNHDGTFTDLAVAAGVTNDRFSKGVVWGDYDNDGDADLYISNMRGENRLYRNDRGRTFTDVATELAVSLPFTSYPCAFWDYDNDGALDIFSGAYTAGVAELASFHLGLPHQIERNRLYRGDGRGGFADVTAQTGMDLPCTPMGCNFGDLDNDGWLDLYLGTGTPEFFSLMPNVMLRNERGARFSDVTFSGGFGHLQKGHSICFADFDNDGDQDIFSQLGGFYLGDKANSAIYRNPGFGNRWIAVTAVGTTCNRSAIGTRIRVDVIEDGKPRSIYKHVNGGASYGASPLRQCIGLGRAERIERIELSWPASGERQVIGGVPMDRSIRIVEGSDGFTTLDHPVGRLGSKH